MKKTTLVLAALAMAAGLHAQRSSYSVTSDFAYASDYVFRGLKQAGNSFQPSLEVTMDDAYVGVWTNQPITKHENNELDLYGGYKYKLNESISFEGVGTYYWYPEANGALTRHSWELGAGATYTLKGLSASAYYYRDFRLDANTLQGSVGYSYPLEAIGASLDVTGFIGTVDADDWLPDSPLKVHESYSYYGVDVSVPYKLSEKATFTVGGHWAHNRGIVTDDNDHVWWTAGITIGF